MKNKLIILSDLWGEKKEDWWHFYLDALNPYFEITFYDCAKLAQVDVAPNEKKNHEQFVNGGIDKAVQKLIDLEKEKTTILAFSVGGVIAWKYGLQTSNVNSLYAVSSTRLRKEIAKPNANIYLWYGANDLFKPKQEWFDGINIKPNIL